MSTVYALLHLVLLAIYIPAPIVLVGWALVAARRQKRAGTATAPLLSAAATVLGGTAIGLGLCLVYAWFIAHSLMAVSPGQLLLTCWGAIGLLAILKAGDALVQRSAAWGRVRLRWTSNGGRSLAAVLRMAFLVLVLLPFSMAATMTFRPKVVPPLDPLTELRVPYERVEFTSRDGYRLVGWWIDGDSGDDGPADETVLLVHGLGSGKADVLFLADAVRNAGFNVLVFDLRAHGESDGQFSSFGVAEIADVEAAVAWVQANRPEASSRLLGLGASMGAAAMLGARDEQEQSPFAAMAVLCSYDDLGMLAQGVFRRHFPGPVATIMRWTALPAASAHAGQDLARFRPADLVRGAWPVPVLVVHGELDATIPFTAGKRLYEAAFEPKRSWWVPGADHNTLLSDPTVMRVVLQFYEDAKRAPKEGVV